MFERVLYYIAVIDTDGRNHTIIPSKRDDFNLQLSNFSAVTYPLIRRFGVFISQLICNGRNYTD